MIPCLRVLLTLHIWRASCGPIQRTTSSPHTEVQDATTPSAQSRLDEVIRNADKSSDKITLHFPPTDWKTTDDETGRPRKPVVKRADVGQTASFVCNTSSENASDVLTWTHQGQMLVHNGHALPSSNNFDQQYSISYHGQVAILSIFNVSLASSGKVICYETLSNTTTTILRRYSLLPNVHRAAEVFAEPMPNWSVTKEAGETFWCRVRLVMPLRKIHSANKLYLWRHNNRTVVAPDTHPYTLGSLTAPEKPPYIAHGFTYNTTATTFTFFMRLLDVDVEDSGTVECWFRATSDVDDWFVQSSRLDVHRQPMDWMSRDAYSD